MHQQVLRAVWSGANADVPASIAPVSEERDAFCSGSLIRIGAANLIKIGHFLIRLAQSNDFSDLAFHLKDCYM